MSTALLRARTAIATSSAALPPEQRSFGGYGRDVTGQLYEPLIVFLPLPVILTLVPGRNAMRSGAAGLSNECFECRDRTALLRATQAMPWIPATDPVRRPSRDSRAR